MLFWKSQVFALSSEKYIPPPVPTRPCLGLLGSIHLAWQSPWMSLAPVLRNVLPPSSETAVPNPKTLYAVIESDLGGTAGLDTVRSRSGGIFRTDDSGAHWKRVSDLAPRGF